MSIRSHVAASAIPRREEYTEDDILEKPAPLSASNQPHSLLRQLIRNLPSILIFALSCYLLSTSTSARRRMGFSTGSAPDPQMKPSSLLAVDIPPDLNVPSLLSYGGNGVVDQNPEIHPTADARSEVEPTSQSDVQPDTPNSTDVHEVSEPQPEPDSKPEPQPHPQIEPEPQPRPQPQPGSAADDPSPTPPVHASHPFIIPDTVLRSPKGPPYEIPGSQFRHPDEVAGFRARLECMATRGKWVPNRTPRLLPWSPNRFLDHCDDDHVYRKRGLAWQEADDVAKKNGDWYVRGSLKWEWKVDRECDWRPFEWTKMCRLLDKVGHVLFVGDSMTKHWERSLYNNMYMGHGDDPPIYFKPDVIPALDKKGGVEVVARAVTYCSNLFNGGEGKRTVLEDATDETDDTQTQIEETLTNDAPKITPEGEHMVVTSNSTGELLSKKKKKKKKPTMVRMVRNDVLSVEDASKVHRHAWFKHLKKWNIKVLILNTGAHYREDKAFQAGLNKTLTAVRAKYPKMIILYRSTPKGHKNCQNFRDPEPSPQEDLPNHWGDFHRQNMMAKVLVEKVNGVYFDVEPICADRADGHLAFGSHLGNFTFATPDCLHYCNPGPLDTWVYFLYNALFMLVDPGDQLFN